MATHQLLRLPAVLAMTGVSRSTLYRLVQDGKFPKPISVGTGRAVAWLESDIDKWIDTRIDQSLEHIELSQPKAIPT